MKVIRTTFQHAEDGMKLVLVVDLQKHTQLGTHRIPHLSRRMQKALPGIFLDDSMAGEHSCGGGRTSIRKHSFESEIEAGTDIPHLLEHLLLHLLSRRTRRCEGYCGQRSSDIERGIHNRHYLVVDCPSEIEGLVAVSVAMRLIRGWLQGKDVRIDPTAVYDQLQTALDPMLRYRP